MNISKVKYLIVLCIAILATVFFFTKEYHSSKVQTGEVMDSPENPDKRRELELLKRGGKINFEKVEKGRRKFEKEMRIALNQSTRDGGIMSWEDLGPKNIGGRIRAIAIHPTNTNTIFIGAAAGGIWRSTDGGDNWTLRNPVQQAYPVTSIVYDPFDSNIMYAATGEFRGGGPEFPGVGILKSTNGGSSWSVLDIPAGQNFFWFSKIEMNPLLQNSFYAVGSTGDIDANQTFNGQGVIYRTDDGGQTWRTVFNTTSILVTDIEVNPIDTNEIIIGHTLGASISIDSGNSFSPLTGAAPLITTPGFPSSLGGRRCEVEYCGNDPDNIYVSRNLTADTDGDGFLDYYRSQLWQSTDGGANWDQLFTAIGTDATVNPLTRQGNYSHALWVDPTDCDKALLGGINLWKWENSALTRITNWADDIGGNAVTGNNNSVHADFHVIIEDPNYDGNNNKAIWLGNDGGIYGTNDIWAATINSGWFAKNTELNITQLYGADISLSGDTILGGSQDNSFFFDLNASNGLQIWNVNITGDGGFCAIDRNDTNNMYATTQNGSIFRSTDGGNSFCNIARFNGDAQSSCCSCSDFFNNGATDDNPLFIAPLKIDPQTSTTIYLGARQLWKGENKGNDWTSIKPDIGSPVSTIAIHKSDNNIIWAGHANGDVYMTTTGGGNAADWTQVDINDIGLPDRYITDIDISPLDPNDIMVVIGGYEADHIFYTDDAGLTWQDRSLGFDMHIETVTWHPQVSTWVYVGTDVGIFASEDNGNNWNVTPVYNNNDGPVYTQIAELFWQGNGTNTYPYFLCAATHGRGVWRTEFPIRKNIYVDKTFSGIELGSFNYPYNTFKEALTAAGAGSTIIFKSSGDYEEIPPSILIDNRIDIKKLSGVSGSVVIK